MSWWAYIKRVAPDAQQADIAAATGVAASTVSRWSRGKQGVDPKAAVAFARAYDRPVLEALVEAGVLTPVEAKQRPTAAPSIDSLTDDELVDEIRRRLADGTSTTRAGVSPVTELRQAADRRTPKTEANRRARAERAATQGEESQDER